MIPVIMYLRIMYIYHAHTPRFGLICKIHVE